MYRSPHEIGSSSGFAMGIKISFPGSSITATRRFMSSYPRRLPPEVLKVLYVTLSRDTAPIIHLPHHWLDASARTDHEGQT